MEHTSEFDEKNGLCKIRVTGEFNVPEDALALRDFGLKFNREKGYSF